MLFLIPFWTKLISCLFFLGGRPWVSRWGGFVECVLFFPFLLRKDFLRLNLLNWRSGNTVTAIGNTCALQLSLQYDTWSLFQCFLCQCALFLDTVHGVLIPSPSLSWSDSLIYCLTRSWPEHEFKEKGKRRCLRGATTIIKPYFGRCLERPYNLAS